jgi:hypothetical protein
MLIPDSRVLLRRFYQSSQLPLTRLETKTVAGEELLAAERPRIDRNATGDLLETNEGLEGWGLGVHAPSVLSFKLPDAARSFRTRFGLDKRARHGGCVKVKVWATARTGQPLYESEIFVGAERTFDTGTLVLPQFDSGPHLLWLEVDAVPHDRPRGADPLNIRDFLDWVDPVVELDSEIVRRQIKKSLSAQVFAWNGWRLEANDEFSLEYFLGDEGKEPSGQFRTLVKTAGMPLRLAKDLQLESGQNWLQLTLFSQTADATSGRIEFRVDGRLIAQAQIPTFDPETQVLTPPPLWVSLAEFASTGRSVRLELVYVPASANEMICWQRIDFAESASKVAWKPLVPLEVKSVAGTKLTIQPDHSILAEGLNPAQETYLVTARIDRPRITAVRLEALPDDRLPKHGPGRSEQGDFALTRVTAVETDSVKEMEKFQGRFVRIDLPGEGRVLSLAEVQVFSGGQNVALRKPARSSSALHGGVAAKAVDGHTVGIFKRGSVTHSANEVNPWWEVDLGRSVTIDRILVWNRTCTAHECLANHVIRVLDGERKVVWELANPEAPFPFVAYGPFIIAESPLKFAHAAASPTASPSRVQGVIEIGGSGLAAWSAGSAVGRPHALVLTLPEPAKLRGKSVTFRLVQHDVQSAKNLGRFRLSTTNQKGPIAPEAPATIVPPIK